MIIDTSKNTECRVYDGILLHNRFAYKFFKNRVLPQGNIIAYRAPAKVEAEGMIDLEDLSSADFIYSDDMIHFLYELPMIDNAFGAVCFQRMFNSIVANILSVKFLNAPIEMKGDDMIVHKPFVHNGINQSSGKASVSIVHIKNNVALGHTGINVNAGISAPVFAYSTRLTDEQVKNFMDSVISTFYSVVEDIFIATTKTIS
jgi:hypothetical protein